MLLQKERSGIGCISQRDPRYLLQFAWRKSKFADEVVAKSCSALSLCFIRAGGTG